MPEWGMYAIFGVLIVGMIAFQFISNKKKTKQRQELLNSMGVGSKIMTIGGMYGEIIGTTSDNRFILNVGLGDQKTVIVIDKQSIRNVVQPAFNTTAPTTATVETTVEKNEESK
ncbi:MAG: preprotein translocase subunit YajC [Clostridiales bacterium]|jgi:preprotein translocase subunit YajC|nr:preprotein translocase subunit YajC [Clostridiales bacterium]